MAPRNGRELGSKKLPRPILSFELVIGLLNDRTRFVFSRLFLCLEVVKEVKNLINARAASELLGLRLPRLYELARLRVVPFVRFGPKQIRFDPEVLAEWSKGGGLITPDVRKENQDARS